MIKAVIFDMDGVVIDSEPVYMSWIRQYLQKENIVVSEKELLSLAGISSQEYRVKLEQWWNEQKPKKCDGENIYKQFDDYCEQFKINYKTILNSGVEETIKFLISKKIKIAIASSSPMKDIVKVLKETGLMQYINVIASGADFNESKPNPEIYNYTVEKLNVSSDECIAVEDSTYGIMAAINAGITVIAKEDHRFDFSQQLADYLVKEISQIKKVVNNINTGA